ncbi:hypothetical protein JMUB7547_28550 [Staphylococcus aureus]
MYKRQVKDGVMDASQGYAFTEKLKRDFAEFNGATTDITTCLLYTSPSPRD